MCELKLSLQKKTTIDNKFQTLFEMEQKHWHGVIERLIAIIQYLASCCLAFRGTSNRLYDKNNDNFLKAVEMVAKFDPVMSEHLRRIKFSNEEGTRMPHYLGDMFQNEIITSLSKSIQNTIIGKVKEAKYFSIIVDSTPDSSRNEQVTLIIRFVDIQSETVSIAEHFLGFFEIHETTGEGFFQMLTKKLEEMGLDITNLRGQGYDNGENMKGKHVGLQRKILDINPKAFFVPCAAHSLNLVVNDAAKTTFQTISYFNLIQELYNFFSSSTYRWDIFKNEVTNLTIKSVSETRWEVVLMQYGRFALT